MSPKTSSLIEILQKLMLLRQRIFSNNCTTSQDDLLLFNEYCNSFNQTIADATTSDEEDQQLIETIAKYFKNLHTSILAKGEFLIKRADIFFSLQSKLSAITSDPISCDILELERPPSTKQIYYSGKYLSTSSNASMKFSKRSNYPKNVTFILKNWLENNINHPYPDEEQKIKLSKQTGLCLTQINNWFINARRRILPDLTEKRSVR